ncbi:hypothetical protein EDB86DRAFT_3075654 [Lactarius hatsudake]|nr:hypothetical protein EDB86DRAFT_3075654 [Lactarius hatsudake]
MTFEDERKPEDNVKVRDEGQTEGVREREERLQAVEVRCEKLVGGYEPDVDEEPDCRLGGSAGDDQHAFVDVEEVDVEIRQKARGKTRYALDRLTQEEAWMATAEVLRVMHGVDDKVKAVDDRVKQVDHRVAVVNDYVKLIIDGV